MDEQETYTATTRRIVFQNPDNGWTVCRVELDESDDMGTVVGSLPGLQTGQLVTFTGTWITDPKYGKQFKASAYQVASPKTLIGIEKYIASGLLPGVGPELAKRIVATFGHETLEVLDQEPDRLSHVEGIGPSKVAKIKEHYKGKQELQSLLIFLQGHGVSPTFAPRIHQVYGSDAARIIRENPYRMAIDIWGIGFRTADGIAQSLGIEKDSPSRVEAGVLHALGLAVDNGHLHIPRGNLISESQQLLSVSESHIESAIGRLELSNLIIDEELNDKGRCVSLWRMWELEVASAKLLAKLAATEPPKPPDIKKVSGKLGIELSEEQKQAVTAALKSKVSAITGGPGVGKTTIVKVLVDACIMAKRRVLLCAPTGRAAKRLSEAAGMEASTIHRLLEFKPHDSLFARNMDNLLEADFVVVDEASMVDIAILQALLSAVPTQAQVVFVGDADQLPSVGPGNVLADLLDSEFVSSIRLTKVFRQAQDSSIIQVAHSINRGDMPEIPKPNEGELGDLYFINQSTPDGIADTIKELVASRIPDKFGLDPLTDIQVLTPMHRGPLGTAALNEALQVRLNGTAGQELVRGSRKFRQGDKVMQIKNDHDRGIYNGDIGIVCNVTSEALHVDFGSGPPIGYERASLDQLVHAYAISVHKSQGSEYPCVVIPVSTHHFVMLQRNLIYTGITRGKRLVILIGQQKALKRAVQTIDSRTRNTYLTQRIETEVKRLG